jgi:hypothetical protein
MPLAFRSPEKAQPVGVADLCFITNIRLYKINFPNLLTYLTSYLTNIPLSLKQKRGVCNENFSNRGFTEL